MIRRSVRDTGAVANLIFHIFKGQGAFRNRSDLMALVAISAQLTQVTEIMETLDAQAVTVFKLSCHLKAGFRADTIIRIFANIMVE